MQYSKMAASILFVLASASWGQSMYRCGSTFSQTPCGAGQQEIEVKAQRDCDLEANRYMPRCARASASSGPHINDAALAEYRRQKADLAERRRHAPPEPAKIEATKRTCETAVRAALKDPEGARVRDVTRMGPSILFISSDKTLPAVDYSMIVNGKNSYGGYAGEKPWLCVLDPGESNVIKVNEVGFPYLKQPWYDQ
jgi:hypothetical protein